MTTPLGVGRFGGEHVDELVHRVTRVALHPRKVDVAFLVQCEREELLPEVSGPGLPRQAPSV
jgi:hypothetical protein